MIVEVSPERAKELIEKVAKFVAERRMGAPAILFLESVRPLTFVGSQVMYFISPFITTLFNSKEFEEFSAMMTERHNADLLIKRIDELDEEFHREYREKEKIKRTKFFNKIKSIFKKNKKVEEYNE